MAGLKMDRIKTPQGVFLILFSEAGIYEVVFPGSDLSGEYEESPLLWTGLAEDFDLYFKGKPVNWSCYPLDRTGYLPFTLALLNEVSLIPMGKVITYRQAAERAGSPLAWRAAGQALKANRHPVIVPCHRVIGSNGRLGGFSGPSGWKEMLLKLEGAI